MGGETRGRAGKNEDSDEPEEEIDQEGMDEGVHGKRGKTNKE